MRIRTWFITGVSSGFGRRLTEQSKWGIEGFVESVAQEVAAFGIGMALVEPGGARTEFRYRSARVAKAMPIDDNTPAHAFMRMLAPTNGLAPGDPARMAVRIIESADIELAASTDFPPGE